MKKIFQYFVFLNILNISLFAAQQEVQKDDKAKKEQEEKIKEKEQAVMIMLENGYTPVLPAKYINENVSFDVYLENGKTENINLKMLKGPIILHFWATWCPPCKRELPLFDAFCKKFNSKIKIFSICIDLKANGNKTQQNIRDFYKNNNIENMNICSDSNDELIRFFNINGIPDTVIIKDGMILGHFVGAINYNEALESAIEALLF